MLFATGRRRLASCAWVVVMITVAACTAPTVPTADTGGMESSESVSAAAQERPQLSKGPTEDQVLRMTLPAAWWPDPATDAGWGWSMHLATFGRLARTTVDAEIVPELAERWETSDDQLTWTFYLREDALFSDGSPVTAEDVKFSMDRLAAPETAAAFPDAAKPVLGFDAVREGAASELEGIEVLDERTIRFTLSEPIVYFPAMLANFAAGIVSQSNVEEGGDEWWRAPVTSGPFMVDRFEPGEATYMELVPNPHYCCGDPQLQRVTIQRVNDPATRLVMYDNDELDVLIFPEPADVAAALDGTARSADLITAPLPGHWWFHFRHDREPFDDIKVRQAFIAALDVDTLAKTVLKGTLQRMRQITGPGTACRTDDDHHLPFDPDRAKELLAESSYGSVENLPKIRFFVSEPAGITVAGQWTRMATAMTQMWAENLGAFVQIQRTEFEFEESQEGAAQIYRSSGSPLLLDPAHLTFFIHTGTTHNKAQYDNPQVDAWLDEADTTIDIEKRCELYQMADRTAMEEGMYVTAFPLQNNNFVKPWVQNFEPRPLVMFWVGLSDIYMAEH